MVHVGPWSLLLLHCSSLRLTEQKFHEKTEGTFEWSGCTICVHLIIGLAWIPMTDNKLWMGLYMCIFIGCATGRHVDMFINIQQCNIELSNKTMPIIIVLQQILRRKLDSPLHITQLIISRYLQKQIKSNKSHKVQVKCGSWQTELPDLWDWF